jgi:hypothetical protein
MAMTTGDLGRAREFWVGLLACPILEEREGEYFIVDAGGLKLCVDIDGRREGDVASDPVIAFKIASVRDVVAMLRTRGVSVVKVDTSEDNGTWAEIRDPDGRPILLTESD